MDTTSDETPACAACGQPAQEGHACSTGGPGRDDGEPRISIPAELWNTGLFKRAWTRNAAEGVAETTSMFDPGPESPRGDAFAQEPPTPVDETGGTGTGTDADEVRFVVPPVIPPAGPEDGDALAHTPPQPHDDAPDDEELTTVDEDQHTPEQGSDAEGDPTWGRGTDSQPSPDPTTDFPRPAGEDPIWSTSAADDTDAADEPDEEEVFEAFEADVASPDADGEQDDRAGDVQTDAELATAFDPQFEAEFGADGTEGQPEFGGVDDLFGPDVFVEDDAPTDTAHDPDATALHHFPTYEVGDDDAAAGIAPEAFGDAPATGPLEPFTEPFTEPAQPGDATAGYDLYGDATAPGETLRGESLSSLALPSSVPFAPAPRQPRVTSEVAPAEEVVEERRSRRGLWALAVVLVLVVCGGGWFFWQNQQNAPVRDAFTTSNDAFLSASAKLEAAGSIEQVALAGAEFARTSDLLTATNDATREHGSDVAVAARRAALAQAAVADAAAPLKELSTENLAPWGTAREALTTALEGLPEVKDDISTAGGSTSGLPDVSVVEHTQTVIGEQVVSSAGAQVVEQLEKLQAAALLADVRAVGTSAVEFVEPLTTAAQGLGDETKAASLSAYADFYEALAGLQGVRPKNLDAWPKTRDKIAEAAEALPSGKETATEVLAATDRLVERAQKKFAAWETKHAAAKTTRAQDLADLEAAITAVDETGAALESLRTQLQDFAKGAGSLPAQGREGEAFRTLDGAAKAREDLLTTLTGLSVPKRAQGELEALVEVVRADAETTRAAADAAAACEGRCRLTSRPAWGAMLTQNTEGATAWTEALEAWTPVSEETKERVAKRKLPKRPKI